LVREVREYYSIVVDGEFGGMIQNAAWGASLDSNGFGGIYIVTYKILILAVGSIGSIYRVSTWRGAVMKEAAAPFFPIRHEHEFGVTQTWAKKKINAEQQGSQIYHIHHTLYHPKIR
jgi:hypothetical protein